MAQVDDVEAEVQLKLRSSVMATVLAQVCAMRVVCCVRVPA